MSEFTHPMRDIAIMVYQRVEGDSGPAFIAKYEPFPLHPIFFPGSTADHVRADARAFADAAVEKYEAQYAAKAERAALGKKRRDENKSAQVQP